MHKIFIYKFSFSRVVLTTLLLSIFFTMYSQQNTDILNDSIKYDLPETGGVVPAVIIDTSVLDNKLNEIQLLLGEEVKNSIEIPTIDSAIIRDHLNEYIEDIDLPLIKKEKIIENFNISAGVNLAYFPVTDTNYIKPGIHKSYWVNMSQTIYGLPFQFGAATGDGVSYNDEFIKSPVNFNFNFDYHQYVANVQSKLICEYNAKKDDVFKEFETINFKDSLEQYNVLKDTLANTSYLVYVNKLKDKRSAVVDSIDNCYDIDSTSLLMIDSSIAQYEKYRSEFNRMLKFQETYYSVKSEYEEYLQKLETVKQTIGEMTDLSGLMASAEEFGLSSNFPKWPLQFKKFQIGSQFMNFTPLTFQNYASNGVNIDYTNDALIVKAAALSRNWYGGYSVANGADSLFNLFQNNQTAYITGVGFGNPDSSHILFSAGYIKEDINSTENESTYSNLLVSLYQKTRLIENLFLEYEVAKSRSSIHPKSIEADTLETNELTSESAIYTKLSYTISKSKTEILADQSFIGSSYITLGNPFIKPGTINSGIGIKQSLLKSKILLSYKLTFSNTSEDNPENVKTYYHIAQLDYIGGRIGSLHMTLSPYQYNYSIDDITNSENTTSGNFINCYAVINVPVKKNTVTSIISYSNFSTQNSFSDTVFYLNTNTISSSTMATIKGRMFSLNTIYYIPQKEVAFGFVNSIDLKANIFNSKKIYMDCGPKWLGYQTYNDQLGGSANITTHIGKTVNWSLMLDKYFEIEHAQEDYQSSIFFNTSLSITLN